MDRHTMIACISFLIGVGEKQVREQRRLGWGELWTAAYLRRYYDEQRVDGERMSIKQMLCYLTNDKLQRLLKDVKMRIELLEALRGEASEQKAVEKLGKRTGRQWSEKADVWEALNDLDPDAIIAEYRRVAGRNRG